MSDNHWTYTPQPKPLAAVIAGLGASHKLIKPHCPWQNGKVERLNRTLQTEWAYRQVFTSNAERTAALEPWLTTTTTDDATAPRRPPTISRLSPT